MAIVYFDVGKPLALLYLIHLLVPFTGREKLYISLLRPLTIFVAA